MRRLTLSLLLLLVLAPVVARGQDESGVRVDVIDISGPLDGQALGFIRDTLSAAAANDSTAVILQLDSPGVVAEDDQFQEVLGLVEEPPLPLAVWVGPAPAVAYGGALELLAAAPLRLAAPGVELGYGSPVLVAGEFGALPHLPAPLRADTVTVEGPMTGVVDAASPAVRQVLERLQGASVVVDGSEQTLDLGIDPDVVFHKPGFWARFLRLAVTPEAAFLFVIGGLSVAAFEFYAIGPGLAAAVAAVSLFLATYGIAVLPVRWWALALVLVGWWALTASYQRGGVAGLTGAGGILTLLGGLWYVDGAPQLQMNPVVTTVIVAVVFLFYVFAMPTVARSRFSTRTIGRDHLIGAEGTAMTGFDPDGEVEVAGAVWKATAHREAGVRPGDRVTIVDVDGPWLEVEPATATHSDRENQS